MAKLPDGFQRSSVPEPHRARTKRLLKEHPQIRELIGPNPRTFWWTCGLVAFQTFVAWLVQNLSWWAVFGLAYVVGAFANHALFVLIHEATHNLVFRRRLPNMLTGLLANLPLFFPSFGSFKKYHLKHHAFQGVYDLDADLPSECEARLIGHSAFGKALWLLLYPFFQMVRPFRLKEIPVLDGWTAVNWIIQVSFNVAVYLVLGPKALCYMGFSLLFSIGLHPLGARWIQRHYITNDGDQETFSYYGPLNKLAFNVGYHNEHHDFPSVAWDKLPRIREAAPDVYERLFWHGSWTRLLFKFLLDSRLSLYARIVREDRAGVPLTDESTPDVELVRSPS